MAAVKSLDVGIYAIIPYVKILMWSFNASAYRRTIKSEMAVNMMKANKMTSTTQERKNGFVHAIMLLTSILVASSFPVGATITYALPPAVLMLLRFLLAALLFAPYVFIRNGFSLPSFRHSIDYLIISIPLVVFFWCMFESLRYTSLLNTGALFTLVPAATALFATLINKDTIGGRRALGLLLATFGAIWIVFRGDWDALVSLKLNYGDFVFLIGVLSLGLYNVFIKRFYHQEPVEMMTFWVLCWGAVWLLLMSWRDLGGIDWLSVDMKVFAGIAYLSLFTTLTTFFLVQFSIVRIGATKAAAYNFLTPVFVILLSILLGMENFIPITVPGILLVVGAMIMIQREKERRPSTKVPPAAVRKTQAPQAVCQWRHAGPESSC